MSKPIDPTDERALYGTWVEAFERTNAEFFDGTRGKDEPRGDTAGMLAVARAVCPEHHAVYDTRTHVALPVSDMEKVVDAITDRAADLLRSVLYGIGDTPDGMCQQCGGYGLVSVPCDVGFADGMCPDCNGSGELNEATP